MMLVHCILFTIASAVAVSSSFVASFWFGKQVQWIAYWFPYPISIAYALFSGVLE